jgi:hypothetical protein
MKTRLALTLPALVLALAIGMPLASAAQVATLRTPDPEAVASAPPSDDIDGQEALLQFASCMRDNGIDFPDPQFGVDGQGFGQPPDGVDFLSSDFLDAIESCQQYLEALQPEVDAVQQAEQNEQLIAFAECMRSEGVDFPDPDPVRGLTIGSFRDDAGNLTIDPFSSDFQQASGVCAAQVGVDLPGGGQDAGS